MLGDLPRRPPPTSTSAVEEIEPTVVLAPAAPAPTPVPLPLTPKAAAARALMDWRDKPLQQT